MQEIDINEIIRRVDELELPHFDVVVGISRGGCALAGLLSEKLECQRCLISIRYRDDKNVPCCKEPEIQVRSCSLPGEKDHILLVDDVSVTGKTITCARKELPGRKIQTLVLKGKADYVLFPEIEDCVKWPWSPS